MAGRDWREEALLSLAGVFLPKRPGVVPLALSRFLGDYPQIRTIRLHLDNDAIGRGAARGILEGLGGRYRIIDAPPGKGCQRSAANAAGNLPETGGTNQMMENMVGMTYREFKRYFRAAERAGRHLTGYLTFSQASFEKEYSEESRTYAVSSDNKAFWSRTGSCSIFGSALDGSDEYVRLDHLMASEQGGPDGWQLERCCLSREDFAFVRQLLRAEQERQRDGEAR